MKNLLFKNIKNIKFIKDENSTLSLILWIFSSFDKRRKKQLVGLFLIMTLCSICEILTLSLLSPFLVIITNPAKINDINWINKLFLNFNSDYTFFVLSIGILLVILNFITAVLRLLNIKKNAEFAASIGSDFSAKIISSSLNNSYTNIIDTNTSLIFNAATLDVGRIILVIAQLMQMLTSIVITIGIIVTLSIINFKVTLISFLGFTIAYLLIIILIKRRLLSNTKLIHNFSVSKFKTLQESLGSIRDVLLHNQQKPFINEYLNSEKPMRMLQAENTFLSSFPKFLLEGLVISVMILFSLIMKLSLSFGEEGNSFIALIGVFALGTQKLLPSLQQIYLGWTTASANQAHIKSIKSFNSISVINNPNKKKNYKTTSFSKSIIFENVYFSFKDKSKYVLKAINFELLKGEKIGLIGKTGSGKSTLVDIIMGLLNPDKGKIYIDGIEINNDNLIGNMKNWQSQIAHVPQNIFLSDKSFAENIAFGIKKEKINLNKVRNAAAKANIKSFIESKNNGFHSNTGERGNQLSGGQIQRIGLARAFYRDAKVLILDEATSALDISTEKNVIETIFKAEKKITLIMISHNINSLKKVDRILFLNNGNIDEVNYEHACEIMESINSPRT